MVIKQTEGCKRDKSTTPPLKGAELARLLPQ